MDCRNRKLYTSYFPDKLIEWPYLVYLILSLSICCFKSFSSRNGVHKCCKNLTETIHWTHTLGCWCPAIEVGGQIGEKYEGVKGRHKRNWKIARVAARLFSLAQVLYSQEKDLSPILDSPNLPCMLELFAHTIPLYGPFLDVSELALEFYHEVLKRGLEYSTHIYLHVTAVQHALATYWQTRISHLLDQILLQNESQEFAIRTLGQVSVSEEAYALLRSDELFANFLAAISSRMDSNWMKPFCLHMKDQRPVNWRFHGSTPVWDGVRRPS